MSNISSSEAAKAVVRRNIEQVQGEGRFDVFDELFADDFTVIRRSRTRLKTRQALVTE